MSDDSTARANGLARHLAAENAHDVDAIVHTFAADGVLVLNGVTFRGRETLRKVHAGFGFGDGGAFSDLRVREIHRHIGPDAIVLEERLSGRHTGTWEGLAPTGREFEIAVCAVYELDALGELTAERVYFDGSALLRQLRGTAAANSTPTGEEQPMSSFAAGELPDLVPILARVLQRVPPERQPLLIATAERLAADRYRAWADDPGMAHRRSLLLACAGREEEIATHWRGQDMAARIFGRGRAELAYQADSALTANGRAASAVRRGARSEPAPRPPRRARAGPAPCASLSLSWGCRPMSRPRPPSRSRRSRWPVRSPHRPPRGDHVLVERRQDAIDAVVSVGN